jgi:hypothetical protein
VTGGRRGPQVLRCDQTIQYSPWFCWAVRRSLVSCRPSLRRATGCRDIEVVRNEEEAGHECLEEILWKDLAGLRLADNADGGAR